MGLRGPNMGMSVEQRFTKFIFKVNNGCWLWQGALVHGYGSFTVKGKSVRAHRWAYEHFKGPIDRALVVDHLCNVRACVNPAHLRACTQKENTLADHSMTDARRKSLQTHCINGHEFTEENTYRDPNKGYRYCRVCRLAKTERNAYTPALWHRVIPFKPVPELVTEN